MTDIQLTLTQDQARAVCDALDAYSRLCMGQLEEVAKLVRFGVIPVAQPNGAGDRVLASAEACEQIENLTHQMKALLGLRRSGHMGIGNPHLAMSGRRSYEVKKVLSKVVAELRDPTPSLRTVDYDGLGPRYTSDPAPQAKSI